MLRYRQRGERRPGCGNEGEVRRIGGLQLRSDSLAHPCLFLCAGEAWGRVRWNDFIIRV